MQYNIVFQNEASTILMEHTTDHELPRFDEYLQLFETANESARNIYDVSELHQVPINAENVQIVVILSVKE